MQDQICLITGANSGIGKEAALALARKGTTVIMVCRNQARGETARNEIICESNDQTVDLLVADLSSQNSIRELASQVQNRYDALHVLINNAGAAFMRRQETVDGIERTFALNHLGYFLLTNLLLDMLKRSQPSRIVNVASAAHRDAALDLDDVQMSKSYSGMKAYANSKLANILFTYELDRRLHSGASNDSVVTVNALHPGVVRTNIWGNAVRPLGPVVNLLGRFAMRSPQEGAATPIYLASAPEVAGVSGRYFIDCKPTQSSDASYDEKTARRLWEISEALCS